MLEAPWFSTLTFMMASTSFCFLVSNEGRLQEKFITKLIKLIDTILQKLGWYTQMCNHYLQCSGPITCFYLCFHFLSWFWVFVVKFVCHQSGSSHSPFPQEKRNSQTEGLENFWQESVKVVACSRLAGCSNLLSF